MTSWEGCALKRAFDVVHPGHEYPMSIGVLHRNIRGDGIVLARYTGKQGDT